MIIELILFLVLVVLIVYLVTHPKIEPELYNDEIFKGTDTIKCERHNPDGSIAEIKHGKNCDTIILDYVKEWEVHTFEYQK